MHARSPVPFTKFSQWTILHFRSWILRKYSQNLKAFTGRVPCNNWTLEFQLELQLRKSNWRQRKKKATTLPSVQNVFACVSKIYSQYRVRMEKQSFGIFTCRIRSRAHKFSPYGNLRRFSRMKYSVKWKQHLGRCRIVCHTLRYADRLSSLVIYDIPLIKGVSQMV